MAVQWQDKEIFLTVRDLLPVSLDGQPLLSTFPLPKRGGLGRAAQTRFQASQKADPKTIFHTEYRVQDVFVHGNYTLHVSGRIDGALFLNDRVEIEEIKSVVLKSTEFARIKVDKFPGFIAQLLFYAYLLQRELNGLEVSAYLVLVNLIDNKVKRIPVDYNPQHVEKMLAARFDEIIREKNQQEQLLEQRRKEISESHFSLKENRPQQQKMMQAVASVLKQSENLLVSAPTGTGKTAAALFPAIRYAYTQRKKIFFITSKNTQQELAVETAKMVVERGLKIQVVQIRASQKMCANDVYFCHENYCPYAREFKKRKQQSDLIERLTAFDILTPDTIFAMASAEMLCPAEINIDMAMEADIVVGDYNYVFDPMVQLRRLFKRTAFDDWILIVDEAHNLTERGRDYLSADITAPEIRDLLKSQRKGPLKKALQKINEQFNLFEEDGRVYHEQEQYYPAHLSAPLWKDLLFLYESAYIDYLMKKVKSNKVVPNDPAEKLYYRLRRFVQILKMIDKTYALFYDAQGKIRIENLDPSRYIGGIIERFHSVVAMSATLDPMEYYKEVLGVGRNSHVLELGSPFPNNHRKIVVVTNISTLYKDRINSYAAIAKIIMRAIKTKPGNYLAFFPSYQYLEDMRLFINDKSIELIRQERGMGPDVREALLKRLKAGKGSRLLMAVMGGVFSEGVDFAGDMAIGAFIISPALPKISYERQQLLSYYENEKGEGMLYAYIFPAMNKVVQAAGRVIRGMNDKGIIVLIGKRFEEPVYSKLLPTYWFENKADVVFTKKPQQEIKDFWAGLK